MHLASEGCSVSEFVLTSFKCVSNPSLMVQAMLAWVHAWIAYVVFFCVRMEVRNYA